MIPLSKKLAKAIGSVLGIDWDKTDLDEFHMGINAEMEHGSKLGAETNVTKNDLFMTGKIALAHLIEIPDYYTRLKKMESEAETELEEGIDLDIEVGDVVLGGKFKNKRVIVKTIGKDVLGQPTINGKSLLKFRIEKLLPKEKQSKKTRDMASESGLAEMIREAVCQIFNEGDVVSLTNFRKEKRDREDYFNTVLVSTDGRFIFNPDDYLFVELNHRDQADALVDGDVDLAIELGAKVTPIGGKVRQHQNSDGDS